MPIKTELPSSYQPSAPAATPHHQGTVASMEEEQYGEEGYEDYGGYEGGEGYGDASMLEGDQNKGKLTFPTSYGVSLFGPAEKVLTVRLHSAIKIV